ncbi:hypothetical protein BSQ33_19735 [Vibrio gazogenes]|uniref:Uncharacterized protein n=1 Tax=Vibrio gazogenes TaxID=687 RepID=A0A1Z2SL65_VIBGA|nr:hypothetical protein BSQ33_19735 [Vibrio gazogenes]
MSTHNAKLSAAAFNVLACAFCMLTYVKNTQHHTDRQAENMAWLRIMSENNARNKVCPVEPAKRTEL